MDDQQMKAYPFIIYEFLGLCQCHHKSHHLQLFVTCNLLKVINGMLIESVTCDFKIVTNSS